MVYKVERGESSPTANLLGKLSGAFGLSMSTLMARAEINAGRLIPRDKQPVWIDPDTGYIRRNVSPQSDLPLELVEVTLPAGKEVPMPAAAYAFLRQVIWILDGEMVFVEGQSIHKMKEGDCLELGPPADCVFRNEADTECRYVVALVRTAPAAR